MDNSIHSKRTHLLIFIVVGVSFVAGFSSFLWIKCRSIELVSLYPIMRHLRYSFTLQNTTNRLIKGAEFWSFAPVRQTATQQCLKIESSLPYALIEDALGNQVLHFIFDRIPPYGSKIITIKADLMLSETANPVVLDDSTFYLKPEKYIEADYPDIVRLSKDLSGDTDERSIRRYSEWIFGHLQYTGYLAKARGARYALQTKRGDCTEFAYLFTALCRANCIPARCIGGFICSNNTVLTPAGYHNWAEVYTGQTWKYVDPQKREIMKYPSDYIAVRILSGQSDNPLGEDRRFRLRGDGLKVKMNDG